MNLKKKILAVTIIPVLVMGICIGISMKIA